MVERIKFRQSIGRDEAQIGTPLEFNEFAVPVPSIKHFIPRMHAMLQRLSGLPASVFEQMETNEWLACAWSVSRAARGERFDIAIELALAFHCSPSEFLDMPDHLLDALYERTALILRRMNS